MTHEETQLHYQSSEIINNMFLTCFFGVVQLPKVSKIQPEQKGVNVFVKCVKASVPVEGSDDIKEALVGDETGTVLVSLRSDANAALCKVVA